MEIHVEIMNFRNASLFKIHSKQPIDFKIPYKADKRFFVKENSQKSQIKISLMRKQVSKICKIELLLYGDFLPTALVNVNSSFSGYNLVYSGESLRMMFLLRLVCLKI